MRIQRAFEFSWRPVYQPQWLMLGHHMPAYITWAGIAIIWGDK